MDYLNILVVTWWVLAAATFAAFANISRPRPYFTAALPHAGQIAGCALIFALIFGALFLAMSSDKTRLLTFHGQLFLMLVGALLISIVYSNSTSGPGYRIFAIVFATAGISILMWGLYLAAGDVLLPRTVVEGRVDGMGTVRRTKAVSYEITIDESTYRATREVIPHIKVGDRIRAELGAASEIVFSVDVIRPAKP